MNDPGSAEGAVRRAAAIFLLLHAALPAAAGSDARKEDEKRPAKKLSPEERAKPVEDPRAQYSRLFGSKKLSPEEQARLVKDLRVRYLRSLAWADTTWLGVRSIQAPTDNWMMQEMISELKPDYIVETGTRTNKHSPMFYSGVA